MKFGTNIEYDKLYCVTKNQPHIAYQFLYFSIFLSLQKNSVTDFSTSIGAWAFKLCIHLEDGQVYCVRENQIADVYFSFFSNFQFFYLSLLFNAYGYLPSKISKQLLDLGLSNLVQRLGMTSCAV